MDDHLAPKTLGQSLPIECPHDANHHDPMVGFDALDSLPIRTTGEEIHEAADPTLARATTALSTEGARGPACRRLLARDVQAARVQLRYLEGLRNVVLSRYASGKGSPERLKVLEKLVDNQHRRMLAAIDTLSRLDPAPAAVKISARQAAVVFGRMPDGPR